MESLQEFYNGKTVLVTGHTGFKGSWLALWLNSMGADVIGFSLSPEPGQPCHFEVTDLQAGINHITGDIRDAQSLNRVFADCQPDIVFHLAAQAIVRRSYKEPLETFSSNVMGTANVLAAARQSGSVRSVVVITTDKCYENQERAEGYREDDRLGGHDPYSASKACAELVVDSFRNSFFHDTDIGIATARAGNVIGGGDWAENRLVPDFVRAIVSRQPIVLRMPRAVRPWQHVLEPLCGYLTLGQRLFEDPAAFSSAWNFGPQKESHINVLKFANKLVEFWQSGAVEVDQHPDALHETTYLALDCTKAETELDWSPLLQVDEAIRWTVEWFRQFYDDPNSAATLTQNQTAQYLERINSRSQPIQSKRAA